MCHGRAEFYQKAPHPAAPAGLPPGTPQDITLASLRVEHVFPADEATRAVLIKHLSQIGTYPT